jgi:hypothetical protein
MVSCTPAKKALPPLLNLASQVPPAEKTQTLFQIAAKQRSAVNHPAAGAALRDCAVAFYAKAMAIRYNKSKTSSSVSKGAASQPPLAN